MSHAGRLTQVCRGTKNLLDMPYDNVRDLSDVGEPPAEQRLSLAQLLSLRPSPGRLLTATPRGTPHSIRFTPPCLLAS